jgi:transcriptional regulator with XRE-family HTH domain
MGRQNGAAIRAFREKERLSVATVAGLVGLDNPQSLRNIENGTRPASNDVIWHLARILRVPVKAITRDGTDDGITAPVPAEPEGAAALCPDPPPATRSSPAQPAGW